MSSSSSSSGKSNVQENKNSGMTSDSSKGNDTSNIEKNGGKDEDIPSDGFRLPPSIDDPEDDSGYDTDYGRQFG
ncbi:uncharacterized protein F4807DRAFT_445114 [Annulohypoxylon truncatum]|uniref:uncharacterized protein n=1 Tax=Annulohypoxylon truncatum TaxID=327061 RepID=UPI00200738DC|nr:uncharacterized protein F4807DRAFT_445114 [Annulohypoxylon truncatum]KAI1204948.1 hypothetical protein F4807DRAFT_445114 [Annulohypoxylon truncatum]